MKEHYSDQKKKAAKKDSLKGYAESYAEGHAEAKKEFVLKLLKTDTPEEISEKLEIPLKRVLEIKNGN